MAFVCGLIPSWLGACANASHAAAAPPPAVNPLTQLSLEDLMKLKVSTVSRKTEQWSSAGAVDIITGAVVYTDYAGWDAQPTLRLAWLPDEATTGWAAVSRAVRTPVRLDEDLVSRPGGVLVFDGNNNLKSETVVAFEAGIRRKFGERLAIDLAAFRNVYDNIRSYESLTGPGSAFPWTFKNTLNADGTGAEATVLFEPAAGIFLKGGYRYLDLDLTRDPGSGDFVNGVYEANDPRHVGYLTTRLTLPASLEVDTTVRHASRLRAPVMEGFTPMDLRLGWAPSQDWQFDLVGRNLLDPQHPEFVTPNSANEELARSVTAKATWRF